MDEPEVVLEPLIALAGYSIEKAPHKKDSPYQHGLWYVKLNGDTVYTVHGYLTSDGVFYFCYGKSTCLTVQEAVDYALEVCIARYNCTGSGERQ